MQVHIFFTEIWIVVYEILFFLFHCTDHSNIFSSEDTFIPLKIIENTKELRAFFNVVISIKIYHIKN